MAEHRIRKGAKKVAKGAVDMAKQATGEAVGKVAADVFEGTGKVIKEQVAERFKDRRDAFVFTLSRMPLKDKKDILRRYQAVIDSEDKMAENDFVNNLAKVLVLPAVEKVNLEENKETLRWLDRLPDEGFSQIMEMLDHDAVEQVLARIWQVIEGTVGKTAKEVGKKAGDKVSEASHKAKDSLLAADKEAGRNIRKLHRWLEEAGVVSDGPRFSKKGA